MHVPLWVFASLLAFSGALIFAPAWRVRGIVPPLSFVFLLLRTGGCILGVSIDWKREIGETSWSEGGETKGGT